MEIGDRIQTALNAPNPLHELRALIESLLAQGVLPESILETLEQERRRLRAAAREDDEDVLMEAMDFLTGWCAPQMRLPVDNGG